MIRNNYNGDGLPDYLIQAVFETDVSVVLFDQGAQVNPKVAYVFRSETERKILSDNNSTLSISDVNGDSLLDIVATEPDTTEHTYYQLNDGSFFKSAFPDIDAVEAPEFLPNNVVQNLRLMPGNVYKLVDDSVISPNVVVKSGSSLVIEPGAILDFGESGQLTIEANGSLLIGSGAEISLGKGKISAGGVVEVIGTSDDPVVFEGSTGANGLPDGCGGLVATGQGRLALSHIIIRDCQTGVSFNNNASGFLRDSTLVNVRKGMKLESVPFDGVQVEIERNIFDGLQRIATVLGDGGARVNFNSFRNLDRSNPSIPTVGLNGKSNRLSGFIDFRFNWWDTDDGQQIALGISDFGDLALGSTARLFTNQNDLIDFSGYWLDQDGVSTTNPDQQMLGRISESVVLESGEPIEFLSEVEIEEDVQVTVNADSRIYDDLVNNGTLTFGEAVSINLYSTIYNRKKLTFSPDAEVNKIWGVSPAIVSEGDNSLVIKDLTLRPVEASITPPALDIKGTSKVNIDGVSFAAPMDQAQSASKFSTMVSYTGDVAGVISGVKSTGAPSINALVGTNAANDSGLFIVGNDFTNAAFQVTLNNAGTPTFRNNIIVNPTSEDRRFRLSNYSANTKIDARGNCLSNKISQVTRYNDSYDIHKPKFCGSFLGGLACTIGWPLVIIYESFSGDGGGGGGGVPEEYINGSELDRSSLVEFDKNIIPELSDLIHYDMNKFTGSNIPEQVDVSNVALYDYGNECGDAAEQPTRYISGVLTANELVNPAEVVGLSGDLTIPAGISLNIQGTLISSGFNLIVEGQLIAEPNALYRSYLSAGITVNSGGVFTGQGGSRFIFEGGGVTVATGGQLITQGNADERVVFTTNAADVGGTGWDGVVINGHGDLTGIFVEKSKFGIRFDDGATGQVQNSYILHNNEGIGFYGDHPQIIPLQNNIIVSNGQGIVCSSCSGKLPTINNNSIYANTDSNITITNYTGSDALNATGNWWATVVEADILNSINGAAAVNTDISGYLSQASIPFPGDLGVDPALIAQMEIIYLHNDVMGSPMVATDDSGDVLWEEHYQPFGEAKVAADTNPSKQYTGHVFDSDIGLHYMGARYYDPVVGRFMGIDPVGFAGHLNVGNVSLGFNRYAYANNNPYLYIDPDGELVWFAALLIPKAATYTFATAAAVVAVTAQSLRSIDRTSEAIAVYNESSEGGKDKTDKPKAKASSSNPGDKVRTPDTHSDDFSNMKGGKKKNVKTGEIWVPSNTNHSGSEDGEWKVGPKPGVPPRPGNKITVEAGPNGGRIIKVDS